MKYAWTEPQLDRILKPSEALLKALGSNKKLEGIGPAFELITQSINAAAHTWPTESTNSWLSVSSDLSKEFKELQRGTSTKVGLYKPPPKGGPLAQLCNIKTHLLTEDLAKKILCLIGRGILVTSANGSTRLDSLLGGCKSMTMVGTRRSNADQHWKALSQIDLIQVTELTAFLQETSRPTAVIDFVRSAIFFLEKSIYGPSPNKDFDSSGNKIFAEGLTLNVEGLSLDKDEEQEKSKDEKTHEVGPPDVSKRLTDATFQPYTSKLGLLHRDYLPPKDLAGIASALRQDLDSKSKEIRAFAMLGLSSLLIGSDDESVLKTPLIQTGSIWLDIYRGAWAWDFQVYRISGDQSNLSPDDLEPIYIQLPRPLVDAFREAHEKAGAKQPGTLGELLNSAFGPISLTAFREYLRQRYPSPHFIYRGRIAKSLGFVYLEQTGSDMLSSVGTGRFFLSAPASLFYFNPTTDRLQEATKKVYEYLGLGEPCASSVLIHERINRTKIYSSKEFVEGCEELIRSLAELHAQLYAEPSYSKRRKFASDIHKRVAALLIVTSGGRGSKLERLTLAATHSHPSLFLLDDKATATIEDGVSFPRVLCKLEVLKDCLNLALKVALSLAYPVTNQEASAFLFWDERDSSDPRPLRTSDLHEVFSAYFQGAQINFARALWVTELDRLGVDRWLIRAMTGHSRDVTRVGSAYINFSVVQAAHTLSAAMEMALGNQIRQLHIRVGAPGLSFSTLGILTEQPQLSRIEDPRLIVEPLAPNNLVAANNYRTVVNTLLSRPPLGSKSLTIYLTAVLLDRLPDFQAALNISQGAALLKEGEIYGASVSRRHFAHEFWFPLPVTSGFLETKGLDNLNIDKYKLNSEMDEWLVKNHIRGIAKGNSLMAIFMMAESFRRLNLAPWLIAISEPKVPAPTLSQHSIQRIAGQRFALADQGTVDFIGKEKRKKTHSDDTKFLCIKVHGFNDHTTRLGEIRQRAKDCLASIEDAEDAEDVVWTPYGLWLRSWLQEELVRSFRQTDGCYEISTIYKHLLPFATVKLDRNVDPQDWYEDDWQAFLIAVGFTDSQDDSGRPNDANTHHALAALCRSLLRRGFFVPATVWGKLGQVPSSACRDSASSCIVLAHELKRLDALLQEIYREHPHELTLQSARKCVLTALPLRSTDPGSLRFDCLTTSDYLVIVRSGYNTHKTHNTIRISRLSEDSAEALRTFQSELVKFEPQAKLLLRGQGTPEEGAHEQALQHAFNHLLKLSTGDPNARQQSLRGSVLQNLCTPNWQTYANGILNQSVSPIQVQSWVVDCQRDPTRMASAIAAAGHGDLRSALGHYASHWTFINTLMAFADLCKLEPSPQFIELFGWKYNTLITRRKRAVAAGKSFDLWEHLLLIGGKKKEETPKISEREDAYNQITAIPKSNGELSVADVQFVIRSALGQSKEEAQKATSLLLSRAQTLKALCPAYYEVARSLDRSRSVAQPRSIQGTIDLLKNDSATGLISSLLSASVGELSLLSNLLRFNDQTVRECNESLHVLAKVIPRGFGLRVWIGKSHITPSWRQLCTSLCAPAELKGTPELGGKPRVILFNIKNPNAVLEGRWTGLLRVSVLVVKHLKERSA
jgi:hypothetical protein